MEPKQTPEYFPRFLREFDLLVKAQQKGNGIRISDDGIDVADGVTAQIALFDTLIRGHYQFRGHSESNYKLAPGVARIGGGTCIDLLQEEGIIRNFRKFSSDVPDAARESLWTWLIIGQHYRLKIRLLDWTGSPLTALYFALFREDGSAFPESGGEYVVWCVNYHAVNKMCSTEIEDEFERPLREHFDTGEIGPWMLHTEKLHAVRDAYNKKQTLRSWRQNEVPSAKSTQDLFFGNFLEGNHIFKDPTVFFLQPPSIDPRFVAQDAAFSIMSGRDQDLEEWLLKKTCESAGSEPPTATSKEEFLKQYTWPSIPKEFKKNHQWGGPLFYRICIPHEFGGLLRRWLVGFGYGNKRLFPDREGVARHVNQNYSPEYPLNGRNETLLDALRNWQSGDAG